MVTIADRFRHLPVLSRYVALGALAFGVIGAAVGCVLGLRAYPATAWFATLEVGVPALLLGALLGLAMGSLVVGLRRVRVRRR